MFIKSLLFSTYILHSIVPYSIFEIIFTDLLQKDKRKRMKKM